MPKNSNDSKSHASKVAKRVANKHSTRITIVEEQRQTTSDEGNYQIHGENVIVTKWAVVEFDDIVKEDAECDDERLADLDAVDARVDIDGVCAEDG
jgi:O-succinylbenzoate synthase